MHILHWAYTGLNYKSNEEVDRLIHEVLCAPDYDHRHLDEYRSLATETAYLDRHIAGDGTEAQFSSDDGWIKTSVDIPLPCPGFEFDSEDSAPKLTVDEVYYRRLVPTMKAAFEEAKDFHYTPFKRFWKDPEHPDAPPERLAGEIYSSDAFIEEHEKIRDAQPPGAMETVVAAYILYSDSTHLTNFGTASLWPIYKFYGNQSKYTRGKPGSFAVHHVSYMPSVRTLMGLKMDSLNSHTGTRMVSKLPHQDLRCWSQGARLRAHQTRAGTQDTRLTPRRGIS